MDDLFTGIYSAYCSDSALSNAATGMYPSVAPNDATFPYITYHLIGNVPTWDFGVTTYEQPLIQFSIFSDKINSPSEITQINSDLVLLYDDATLVMTDYTHVMFQRTNTTLQRIDEEEVFMMTTDYQGVIQKD